MPIIQNRFPMYLLLESCSQCLLCVYMYIKTYTNNYDPNWLS